jgi:uncharacterized protein
VRVIVTGSTGLIGSALVESLRGDGVQVLRLVRRPALAADELRWDPATADGGLDPAALNGAGAVVHLAGAPVAGARWTPARKEELRASRIGSTTALVRVILAARTAPPVLLAASAIGWYGDTGSNEVDESAPAGRGFLADLVKDWEAAAMAAATAGVRVVSLRTGLVLSSRGGMLPRLLLPFRLGLGARFGTGAQYMTWITLADQVAAVRFLLSRADLSGPVNLSAPAPVTNTHFTQALAAALHRPAALRVPAGALRLALGEVSTELLSSCRAVPTRLSRAGFAFGYPEIGGAIRAALADRAANSPARR